ncbi:MAG: glycoside hydrolase family 3 N-terminal domain-containing protein [Eubacteriales bacterium]|nr:glycoside hydrolase family 3 N-terminal domain-containing protein [Eubacteriales bacterium]
MAKLYASLSQEKSEREIRNENLVRKLAPEGMVLLKNDGILPLQTKPEKIALYGRGVRNTVKGGTGSGDVNSRSVVNIEEGFKAEGMRITSQKWLDRYQAVCEENVKERGTKIKKILDEEGRDGLLKILALYKEDPDEILITEEDVKEDFAKLALYIISRNSGEGIDRKAEGGDYKLSQIEEENIRTLRGHFEQVILVLNVGGAIDTSCINESGVNAVLLMSQPGSSAGSVLADVILGNAYPSGHLTTTWAKQYQDYPNADKFSYQNGDICDEYYTEGIYVGYRYFDTFNIEPAYPFGYGLSYTTFSQKVQNIKIEQNQLKLSVEVKNEGEYAGLEVVQVYYSAPDGKLEKPYQELVAFAKTKELKAGESELVEMSFSLMDMASYDEETASYILEKGEYLIRVGSHSRNTHIAATLMLNETAVTAKLTNKLSVDVEMKYFSKPADTYSYPEEEQERRNAVRLEFELEPETEHAVQNTDSSFGKTEKSSVGKHKLTVEDIENGNCSLEEFTADLTVTELVSICVGSARSGMGAESTVGAASAVCPGAAGDTTSELLESRKLPNMVLADGPAGLRLLKHFVTDSEGNYIEGLGEPSFNSVLEVFGIIPPERPDNARDYYQYCTAIPIATMLAQSWNISLIEKIGSLVGEEMEEYGIQIWLAPGMNIHRNPLCGRNFEYYSEDPLLSGKCAAADTIGVQSHSGRGTCIKHFALNNQEDNRAHVNAHCSERAIREIYLKGFEIAVKESKPLSIMTSYNLVNGIHSANNKELLTDICRGEWGFEGFVMTDWGTTGDGEMKLAPNQKYPDSSAAGCIEAGNDLIMPGTQKDVTNILEAVEKGELSVDALRACAGRIVKTIFKTMCAQ